MGYALSSIQGKTLAGGKGNFKLDVQLAEGLFFVDNWDGRIYYYRRDAPRSYNMAQLYGKGFFLGMYCRMTFWRHFDVYSRIDYVAKPWNEEATQPALNLKLQLSWRW